MTDAQKAVTEIRAVLIPLESGRLLLPNATVAEVVGYQPPEPVEGGPDWLLGEVEWRQNRIPVVAFERTLGGNPGDPGHRARIVICNTLNGNAERPHIGILARSIPRLVRVLEEGLEVREAEIDGAPVLHGVSVNGEAAWIPDLDLLELMVDEAQGA
jgi:chemosensory pili system protein ChpC